ncbi:alpha/beta fold hydrolase [Cutibacterium sp.]|uniref:alpha/beta fold hydrolase n=1 Tax=Cutibacterium sp. TaxID=1912221 RepID=UPI0026DBD076|nr:alpha/beta hydrolase [Cutibacterium sp.]MDO4412949.1 alpha/beta hydrolase [Cutibacterium sp.]
MNSHATDCSTHGGLALYRIPNPGRPPLILNHGVTDNANSLCQAQRALSHKFDTVAVDARGHGASARFSPQELDNPVDRMVADLVDLLESLNSGPAILVGHSMGAAVCGEVAARRPDLVSAAVLEDPAWLDSAQLRRYREDGPHLADRIRWMRTHPSEALAECRRDYSTWPVEEACAWLQAKMQVDLDFVATGVVCPSTPWREVAARLAAPALVVTSDGADVLVGPDGITNVDALGNSAVRTCLIPGTRHCVRRESSTQFMGVVTSFLDEVMA